MAKLPSKKEVRDIESGVNDIGSSINKLEGPLGTISKLFSGVRDTVKEINDGLDDVGNGQGDNNDKTNKFKELVDDAKDYFKDMVPTVGRLGAGIGIALAVAKSFSNVTGEIGEQFGAIGVKEFRTELGAASISATRLGKDFGDIASSVNTLASDFGVGFEEAMGISGAVLDTSVALGISGEEGSRLVGVLSTIGGLSTDTAQNFAKQVKLLSVANDVAPQAVLKDIAESSEAVALFTDGTVESLGKAAIRARSLGVSLSDITGALRQTLDFQTSIEAELSASALLGRQINLNDVRRLTLAGKIDQAQQALIKQLGTETDFNKLNIFQREELAKVAGMSVDNVRKLISGEKELLSLSQAIAGTKGFEDLLGKDAIDNISQIANSFKVITATVVEILGPGLNMIAGALASIAGFVSESKLLMGGLAAATAAYATYSITAAIASLFLTGGVVGGIAGSAALLAGVGAAIASVPKMAEGGITTGTTLAQIGEAGPEAVLPLDTFFTQMSVMMEKSNESVVNAIKEQKLQTRITNNQLEIVSTPSNA